MITTPKTFFEQVQNFCEEVGVQLKALIAQLTSYYTKSEVDDKLSSKLDATTAASTYLGKTANAVSATKATQDANGNVIHSTYLKKTEKASSATTADVASSATKAAQDSSGNDIGNTYLKKTDAESTYLGKTANAVSATKATQDGNGANIAQTYATIASLNTINTNVTNAQTTANQAKSSADAKVAISGNRGALAGYETAEINEQPFYVDINQDSPDAQRLLGADQGYIPKVRVARGSPGTTWTKSVFLNYASYFELYVSLDNGWMWEGGEIPDLFSDVDCLLVLHWCNDIGIASLVKGGPKIVAGNGTVTLQSSSICDVYVKMQGLSAAHAYLYQIAPGETQEMRLAVGDVLESDGGPDIISSSGITIDSGTVTAVSDGFTLVLNAVD